MRQKLFALISSLVLLLITLLIIRTNKLPKPKEPYGIIQDIKGAVGSVTDLAVKIGEIPMEVVSQAENIGVKAYSGTKALGEEIVGGVNSVVQEISSVDYLGIAEDVGKQIQNAGLVVLDKTKDAGEFVYENVKKGSSIAFNGVKSGVSTAVNEVRNVGEDVGMKIWDGMTFVGNKMKDVGEETVGVMKKISESTVGIFTKLFDMMKDILFSAVEIVEGLITNGKTLGPFINKYSQLFKICFYIMLICLVCNAYFGLMYTLKGGEYGEVLRAVKK